MWVWPQVPLEGPPSTPPCTLGPLPPHQTGPPRPGALQKSQGGWGGRGREREGREGLWLEGRVLQLQWGMGGDPPNTSWGQTHIWGLPIKFDFISDGGCTREEQIRLSLKRHLFPHRGREPKAFWICFSTVARVRLQPVLLS